MSDDHEVELHKRGPTPYNELPDVMQLHRAIGGYVTVFSELISTMRTAIHALLAPVDERIVLGDARLDILLATMTAKPMADAFFGLSIHVASLDDDEQRMLKALRRDVADQVAFRNDLLHAEWSVGWVDEDTGEPVAASALRIKTVDKVPRSTDLGITASDIYQAINKLQLIIRAVRTLGWSCRCMQRGLPDRVRDCLELNDVGNQVRVDVVKHPEHWADLGT
ncbi:hypothetical protein QNM97_12180 [Gordonia sp. L191]|uniref:hypothetical protein n=1 Tax=Gordonia sp. L191 TaxID=2982699 RepID=UPI0024C06065|nr:hypothetical protein [Gordonia sp. L191]WHU49678.1 hypothetical protein QNM97_12180 [Gordonia sp. L191]